jgi:DNA (cytosine-5)-methyltransferase 1
MSLTVTDLFAGAGGSSTGMVTVPGVTVKIAANHWKPAIDIHNANHPDTDHAIADLHQADPHYFPRTDILWASPECTKWSQANGTPLPDIDEGLFEDPLSSEAAVRSRMLMFDVPRFMEVHRYRRVIVENVVDVAMLPKYRTAWTVWQGELRKLGYRFRVVSLNSMHAQFAGPPAPQSRDRLYVVCWLDGDRAPDVDKVMRPKAWCPRCGQVVESRQAWKPGRTVGRYRAQYVYVHGDCGTQVEPGWLPAAAAIDWTMPGQRIGDRAKPLAEKTRARIAAGIARYWRPFTLEAAGNTFERRPGVRTWPADEVLTTLHTSPSKALAVPVEGRSGVSARPIAEPFRTQTARLETAFVAELRGGYSDARRVTDPAATFTAGGNHHALVTSHRFEYRAHDAHVSPCPTLAASGNHLGLVTPAGGSWNEDARTTDDALRSLTTRDAYALVSPYYSGADAAKPATEPIGTLTTVDRYALIHRHNSGGPEMLTPAHETLRTLTTKGHQSVITPGDLAAADSQVDDCLFRMFEPHEVAAGMAFPADYEWQPYPLKKISRRDLVKAAGNAVTPPAARDLMCAVVESLDGAA